MSDMSNAKQKQCFLYQTHLLTASTFLGGGECIKQHPKQILTNQVEKKLGLQHKYPKTR